MDVDDDRDKLNPSRHVEIKKRFVCLVATHLIVACTLAFGARLNDDRDNAPLIFGLFGVLLAQAALVSTWAALSNASVIRRFVGLCAAGGFIWGALLVAIGANIHAGDGHIIFAALVGACLLTVTAAFLSLKRVGPKIFMGTTDRLTAAHQPLQFTTRHLFVLAFVVSGALGLGRLVRARDTMPLWFDVALVSAVMAVCLLYTVLAAVWASLSSNSTRWRALIALLAAVLVGLIPAYYFHAPSILEWLCCAECAGIAQVVILCSLWVVRSGGHRIATRGADELQSAPIVQPSTAHPLD